MSKFYSKEIMEHFKHPQNVGKMKEYDGIGKIGNPLCGDIMWLYIKIDRNREGKEIINKVSFSTFGCIVAIANSSLLTTIVEGKTLEEAINITKEHLLEKLGKMPPFKIHCSVLAIDALHEAIYDYLSKNKKPIPEALEKRHQVLARERKMIEEKYKDWIQKEEELHKQND